MNHKTKMAELSCPTTLPVTTNTKAIRCVCVSDTHSFHRDLVVPFGDIFIHAGDFTNRGTLKELLDFNE